MHSNGFGHLMRLNGREGGSTRASGRQLMQLWDDVCEVLRVREVSTEDVSNKVRRAPPVSSARSHPPCSHLPLLLLLPLLLPPLSWLPPS